MKEAPDMDTEELPWRHEDDKDDDCRVWIIGFSGTVTCRIRRVMVDASQPPMKNHAIVGIGR